MILAVAAIFPFWRYAVCPSNGAFGPGVPFYRFAAAKAFFEEAKATLPWSGCLLIRRRGFFRRLFSIVEEYVHASDQQLFRNP